MNRRKFVGSFCAILVCLTLTLSGCANNKTSANSTATAPATTSATATTAAASSTGTAAASTSASSVDWAKISQYYHTYVADLIAPIGLAAATIADPSAGPAIALASKEVSNLDGLLASKASGDAVQSQLTIIDKAVTDANAKVGAVLAAAQAATGTTASTTSN